MPSPKQARCGEKRERGEQMRGEYEMKMRRGEGRKVGKGKRNRALIWGGMRDKGDNRVG